MCDGALDVCYNDLVERTCLREAKGLMSIHVDIGSAQCLPEVLREYGRSILHLAGLSIWLHHAKALL